MSAPGRAATGCALAPAQQRRSARLVEFRAVEPGRTLRGWATVAFGAMRISGIGVFVSVDGRAWASPPSRAVLDRDGCQRRDRDGKLQYEPVISFESREAQQRFSETVLGLVGEGPYRAALDGWRGPEEPRS